MSKKFRVQTRRNNFNVRAIHKGGFFKSLVGKPVFQIFRNGEWRKIELITKEQNKQWATNQILKTKKSVVTEKDIMNSKGKIIWDEELDRTATVVQVFQH